MTMAGSRELLFNTSSSFVPEKKKRTSLGRSAMTQTVDKLGETVAVHVAPMTADPHMN